MISKHSQVFDKIRSKYILKKTFENLSKKKLLIIIKFNKKIKNKLDIGITNYKEYCETYSSIEIEIIPNNSIKSKFINISNKTEEKYYHIYFNNSKDEIKKYRITENDKINKIKIVISPEIKSFYELFRYCHCIESITFPKFYRNNIENMNGMFYFCSSLKKINLSNVITNNVTDMSYMFSGCASLEKLDLSNFNTNNVTNMHSMFSECSMLQELNISNFNTDKVKNMGYMFYECPCIKKLDLKNFKTNNAKNMNDMFCRCTSLNELYFKFNQNADWENMLYECPRILVDTIKNSNEIIDENDFGLNSGFSIEHININFDLSEKDEKVNI